MKVSHSSNPIEKNEAKRPGRANSAAAANEAHEAKKASAKESPRPTSSDANADISPRSREFAQAKAVATAAPDVREGRVAELKKRISEGSYHVDADAIADRMVDEHLRMSEN